LSWAIRSIACGDALIDPAVTRKLLLRFAAAARATGGTPEPLGALTTRELDVMRLIARGYSNAEIASELVVEESTVKSHVGRILMKLNLPDRAQAVVPQVDGSLAGSFVVASSSSNVSCGACWSVGSGLRWTGRAGDQAELANQRDVVPNGLVVGDLAVLDAEDVDVMDAAECSAGRGDAHERALVGAGPGAVHRDAVPFGHQQLDLPPLVWKRSTQHDRDLLHATRAASVLRIVEIAALWVHELIGQLEPALAEHLLVQPANDVLVLLTAERGGIISLQHLLLLRNRKVDPPAQSL